MAEQAITSAVALVAVLNVADWRDDRIGSALRGKNPTVLARMPGGFAVMVIRSGCRATFLHSMADLGEAVERACRASDSTFRRVDIEILGNADRYLHAHVAALRLAGCSAHRPAGLAAPRREVAGSQHPLGAAAFCVADGYHDRTADLEVKINRAARRGRARTKAER